jgi:hypothetical protein
LNTHSKWVKVIIEKISTYNPYFLSCLTIVFDMLYQLRFKWAHSTYDKLHKRTFCDWLFIHRSYSKTCEKPNGTWISFARRRLY